LHRSEIERAAFLTGVAAALISRFSAKRHPFDRRIMGMHYDHGNRKKVTSRWVTAGGADVGTDCIRLCKTQRPGILGGRPRRSGRV